MVATVAIVVVSTLILGHQEERVVNYVGQMLILVTASHFLNGIKNVLSGLWQQNFISFTNVFSGVAHVVSIANF